jgi:hypothetical protein
MSVPECVHPAHLLRLTIVHVRQSSPHQALTNQESLQLQYNLRDRAHAAGWDPSQVRVIDTDLGRSGRTSQGRRGFQELVTPVNQGHSSLIPTTPGWSRSGTGRRLGRFCPGSSPPGLAATGREGAGQAAKRETTVKPLSHNNLRWNLVGMREKCRITSVKNERTNSPFFSSPFALFSTSAVPRQPAEGWRPFRK